MRTSRSFLSPSSRSPSPMACGLAMAAFLLFVLLERLFRRQRSSRCVPSPKEIAAVHVLHWKLAAVGNWPPAPGWSFKVYKVPKGVNKVFKCPDGCSPTYLGLDSALTLQSDWLTLGLVPETWRAPGKLLSLFFLKEKWTFWVPPDPPRG